MYGKRTYIYCSNSYYPYRAIGMDLEGVPFRRDSPRSPEALLGRWVPRWCATFSPRGNANSRAHPPARGGGKSVHTPRDPLLRSPDPPKWLQWGEGPILPRPRGQKKTPRALAGLSPTFRIKKWSIRGGPPPGPPPPPPPPPPGGGGGGGSDPPGSGPPILSPKWDLIPI